MESIIIRKKTEEMIALYHKAMQAMDENRIPEAIELLSVFIEIMQLVSGPIREVHLAQEALRLCLGSKGTKYFATNHPTLKPVGVVKN